MILFTLDKLTRAWLISPHRKRNRRHPQQRKKHDWLHSSTKHRINGSRLTSSYHSQYQCLHSFLPCSLYVLSDSRLIYTIATVHSRHVSCHLLEVWSFWCPIQTQPSYTHTTAATDFCVRYLAQSMTTAKLESKAHIVAVFVLGAEAQVNLISPPTIPVKVLHRECRVVIGTT